MQKGAARFPLLWWQKGPGKKVVIRSRAQEAGDRLQGVEQLGGVGLYLAKQIEQQIELEVRTTVLGHIQRGGVSQFF